MKLKMPEKLMNNHNHCLSVGLLTGDVIDSHIGISEEIVRHKFLQTLQIQLAPIVAFQKETPVTQEN